MWIFYVACPNTRSIFGTIPRGVAVTNDLFTCSEKHVTYVFPYLSAKEPYKMAIGSKKYFGNVSAELIFELIIEWVEAYGYSNTI